MFSSNLIHVSSRHLVFVLATPGYPEGEFLAALWSEIPLGGA